MPENFIYLISHRLKMISIAILIVSSFGSIHFFPGQSLTENFFGISIGFPECFLLSFFFSSLLIVFEVYDHMTKEKREQQAAEKEFYEFYEFSDHINEYRKSLRECTDDSEGFEELREKLLVFGVVIYGKFEISLPPPPKYYSETEWKKYKEDWRIHLDNLYLCSKGGKLNTAREFVGKHIDLLPPHIST